MLMRVCSDVKQFSSPKSLAYWELACRARRPCARRWEPTRGKQGKCLGGGCLSKGRPLHIRRLRLI